LSNPRERLREMAKLSLLSNRISEIQEKNLKCYPFVFFEDVRCVKVDYNLERSNEEMYVAYDLELNEEPNSRGDTLKMRFLAIERSTRSIFWNDLKVRVLFNGKLVYESENVGKPTSKN
jgi:hypothetical protein